MRKRRRLFRIDIDHVPIHALVALSVNTCLAFRHPVPVLFLLHRGRIVLIGFHDVHLVDGITFRSFDDDLEEVLREDCRKGTSSASASQPQRPGLLTLQTFQLLRFPALR